jgi:hypothetical protein
MSNTSPIEQAETIGREHGKNAASWYFDGNTPRETYELVLRGYDDGDPEIMDTFPTSPLSGEWADNYSLADLSQDTGVVQHDPYFEDVCSAYEDGFYTASTDEIIRVARYMLED